MREEREFEGAVSKETRGEVSEVSQPEELTPTSRVSQG